MPRSCVKFVRRKQNYGSVLKLDCKLCCICKSALEHLALAGRDVFVDGWVKALAAQAGSLDSILCDCYPPSSLLSLPLSFPLSFSLSLPLFLPLSLPLSSPKST